MFLINDVKLFIVECFGNVNKGFIIGLKIGFNIFNKLYFINSGKNRVVNKNIVINVGNKFENNNLFVLFE